MLKIHWFFFVWLFSIELAAQNFVLAKGETVTVPASRAASVHVHSGKVLSVSDFGNNIKVKGKRIGKTFITIANEALSFVIITPEQKTHLGPLKQKLSEMTGLSLDVEPGYFSVKGELLRLSDLKKIAELGIPADMIRLNANVHKLIESDVHNYIQTLLKESQLPSAVISINPKIQLSVPNSSKHLADQFKKVIGHFGIPINLSSSDIDLAPMVRTNIVIASIHRQHMRELGIAWPKKYSAKILPKFSANPSDDATFNFVEENGWGKILASPTLLCRSGKEASLHSGGEYPIKIANYRQKDIFWKKHGVLLKFKPEADYSGRMSISIETEVSSLDGASDENLPKIKTNRMNSHFDVVGSKTIALSGLIMNDVSGKTEGLPGFADIPIFGYLFGSKQRHEVRNELVIFVTPKIVSPEESLQEDQMPPLWKEEHD